MLHSAAHTLRNMTKRAHFSALELLAPLAGAVLVAANLVSVAAPFAWFFELFSHFRLQYALGALVLMAAFGALGYRRWLWLMLAVMAINAGLVLHSFHEARAPDPTVDGDLILQLNLHVDRTEFRDLAAYLNNSDARLVILQEYSETADKALQPALDAEYPFQIRRPSRSPFGMAAYSRVPLTTISTEPLVDKRIGSLRFQALLAQSGMVTITALHPPSPMSEGAAIIRNNELRVAADWVRQQAGPQLVIGDLNVSPYSYVFQNFLASTGLQMARGETPWAIASWPDYTLTNLLRLPIDHALISADLSHSMIETDFSHGSDHAMLKVTLGQR